MARGKTTERRPHECVGLFPPPPLPTGPLPAAPPTGPIVAASPRWRTPTTEEAAVRPPRGAHAAPETDGEGMAAIPQLGILSMPDDPPRRTVPTAPLVLIFAM